jgi:hypothetical protein
MENTKLAVNKRTALKMFYDAGYDTEEALIKAHSIIEEIQQPVTGFWYADCVSDAIQHDKLDLKKYYF